MYLNFFRFQSITIVLFHHFSVQLEFEKKSANLKIQDGARCDFIYVAVVAMESIKLPRGIN